MRISPGCLAGRGRRASVAAGALSQRAARRRRAGRRWVSGYARRRERPSTVSTRPVKCQAQSCFMPTQRERDGRLVTTGGRVLTVGRSTTYKCDRYRVLRRRRAFASRECSTADIGRRCKCEVLSDHLRLPCEPGGLTGHRRLLAHAGLSSASPDEADLVVVNTCSVTATADQGARQTIRRIARSNPDVRIVVTGCYATRRPSELRDLPNVTHVVSNSVQGRTGLVDRVERPVSLDGSRYR